MAMLLLSIITLIRGVLGYNAIAGARSVNIGLIAVTQCLLAAVTTICVAAAPDEQRYRMIGAALFHGFLWSCSIQVAADLTGAFAAVSTQTATSSSPSVSLAAIGINRSRMQMVFASGLNASAVYPTVLLLGCMLYKQAYIALRVFGFALACYLLLAIDSRSAIIAPIAAVILLSYARKWPGPMATISTTMPVWPLLIVIAAAILPDFIQELVSARYARYGMFSGREFIWRSTLTQLVDGPLGGVFLGYGNYGQVTSGVDGLYAHLFFAYNQKVRAVYSLHNAFVQILFDSGVLGLAVTSWAVWTTLRRLGRSLSSNKSEADAARLLLAVMITFLIVGMTEVAFTPYLCEAYGLLMAVMFLSVAMFPGPKRPAG